MHQQKSKINTRRDVRQLRFQPLALRRLRSQLRIAIQDDEITSAELHRVPATAVEFREFSPPVLQPSLYAAAQFVIAQSGKDTQVGSAPGLSLTMHHRPVL